MISGFQTGSQNLGGKAVVLLDDDRIVHQIRTITADIIKSAQNDDQQTEPEASDEAEDDEKLSKGTQGRFIYVEHVE